MASGLDRLRLGVSRCLLGDEVRYDGGHKRHPFLVETLGQFVEWIPVCPEVEVGMGIPREPVHLSGSATAPRLITVRSGIDHTEAMNRFSRRRVRELEPLELCGYVFKKDSPSCGVERVRILNRHGISSRNGVGLFAHAFTTHSPLVPVEEEGRLSNPIVREHFIERIFAYGRWRDLTRKRVTRQALVAFHTVHKYQLLAHSRLHHQELGRLVAKADRYVPHVLANRYGTLFIEALRVKATIRKHVNVLQHILEYFTGSLTGAERSDLHDVIGDYHRGLIPLIDPITLIRHHVNRFDVGHLQNQAYLDPYPKELMLRTHLRGKHNGPAAL